MEWKWSSGAKVEPDKSTEVITDIDKLDCAFCRGRGEKPRGSKCAVCGGSGKVRVEPPFLVCAYCKGRGEEKPRSNVTCTVCRGKGHVSVKEPFENCSKCGGKGADSHTKLPCIMCRGKGVITVKER